MWSLQLLDHFENPRHAGELPAANLRVKVENPVCGDELQLSAKFSETIDAIGFQARGCVASMACGSALTELLLGRKLAELSDLRAANVETAVGGLPPESKHAAILAADAVRKLEQEWKRLAGL